MMPVVRATTYEIKKYKQNILFDSHWHLVAREYKTPDTKSRFGGKLKRFITQRFSYFLFGFCFFAYTFPKSICRRRIFVRQNKKMVFINRVSFQRRKYVIRVSDVRKKACVVAVRAETVQIHTFLGGRHSWISWENVSGRSFGIICLSEICVFFKNTRAINRGGRSIISDSER